MTDSLKVITLKNANGMQVELLNIGARIRSIKFPVAGELTEMTVAYQNVDSYADDVFYLGATCGRVCNRIAKGQFALNEKTYQLAITNGENCLHGGELNFSYRYWQIDNSQTTEQKAVFNLTSAAGDEGFPGQLNVSVVYTLTDDNRVEITYLADSDADTIINLTNHCYFDLGEKTSNNLLLQLEAASYLPLNEQSIPTGELKAVGQGDFAFREFAQLGDRQAKATDEQVLAAGGFDHCYVLDNTPFSQAKATLVSEKNQVKLQLFTDQAGVQLYTGRYLGGEFDGFQGVCLEAQNFPDAINHAHFPSPILRKGEQYKREVVYQFSAL
ncbi:aldose epimerase family protein [Algibacillus agarilyticus]|uniref:aldose epimerase family protein n=1 Tax=Algibacillus agarilyticus TaxID=2234133 RepID=UPI000DCFB0C7|nr:aldose epimerase family protein [Algibacillus agarilyticus]